MGVATSTISLWIKTHKPFSEAITGARVHADAQVAASLFDQAVGYGYTGIQAFKMKDEKGIERVELVEVPQYVPKNVVAVHHWLHNRQRSRWKAVHVEDNTAPGFLTDHEHWFCCRRWRSTARGQLWRRRCPEYVML